jgi:hypothetical protein
MRYCCASFAPIGDKGQCSPCVDSGLMGDCTTEEENQAWYESDEYKAWASRFCNKTIRNEDGVFDCSKEKGHDGRC